MADKRFKYIGGPDGDHFYQGLPAQDLDLDDITIDQVLLLGQALEAGIYEDTTSEGVDNGSQSTGAATGETEGTTEESQENGDQAESD